MKNPGLHIMIVDDDPLSLNVSAALLTRAGHQVTKRTSAIGTAVAIARQRPDAVILDVNMPGLSGDRLAKLLHAGSKEGPVLILHSGMPQWELESMAASCHAAGAIAKAGDGPGFVSQVESILSKAGRLPATPAGA